MLKETVGRVAVIIITGIMILSCTRHFYDVSWNGVVVDEETNIPVSRCNITANCYSQGNMDLSEVKAYNTQTNMLGSFNIMLEKGYKIKGNFSSPGFQTYNFSTPLIPGSLPQIIKLKRHTDSNRYGNIEVRPVDDKSPFIGINFRETDSLKYDFIGIIGFDLINGCEVTDEESADVWIEFSRGRGQIPLVCANREGGLYIPGVTDQASADSLIHSDYAPADGYQSDYRLTGNTRQMYVKCRDGQHYAKIIFDDNLCVMQYNDKGIKIKKMGLRFSYAVQRDMQQARFFPEKLITELSSSLNSKNNQY